MSIADAASAVSCCGTPSRGRTSCSRKRGTTSRRESWRRTRTRASSSVIAATSNRAGRGIWRAISCPIPCPEGVRRVGHDERDRVLDFIEREFGAIWRFECSRAFDRPLPTMFIVESEGEVAGFAAHDVNNAGLGFFGPTGVARPLRGNGFGRLLLQGFTRRPSTARLRVGRDPMDGCARLLSQELRRRSDAQIRDADAEGRN